MARKLFLLASSLLLAALWSCQPQRYLSEKWIREVNVQIDGKNTDDESVLEILSMRANTRVLGAYPYVWLYLQSNANKSTKSSAWLRKIGERPTLWDEGIANKDLDQLSLLMHQNGYFYPKVNYELNQSKRGSTLTYTIERGPGTLVNEIHFKSLGPLVANALESLQWNSVLDPGRSLLTMSTLDAERRRISDQLREQGFYTFGPESVHFEIDTLGHPHSAGVTVRLDNWIRNSEFGAVEEPHRIWVIRGTRGDWPKSLRLRPAGIERLPWISSGLPFRASEVAKSAHQLQSIPAIQTGRWEFKMVQDSLDATLQIVPAPRVGLTWKGEGTALSRIYGVQSSLDLFDNNPTGRLERIHLTISGGVGAQLGDTSTLFNTYALEVEGGVQWPGIWGLPEASFLEAQTQLQLSLGRQFRAEFDRLALGAALHYNFQTNKGYQWDVSPLDLNYIDLRQIDSSFYQALSIKSGFQDIFLLGPRIRVIHPSIRSGNWERRTEWSFESSGLLTDATERLLNPNGEAVRTIAGIPYAHYLRAKVDLRWLHRGSKDRDWAFRLVAGELHTLRNTPGLPPFERAFFAGGSNDLRGWLNFRLGPGALPLAVFDSTGYLGSGTRKLLFQLEYRFPIVGDLSAAVFSDAGNTWLLERNLSEPANSLLADPDIQQRIQFTPASLLKQTAWDAGIGLRYDLEFFVLRVDWGLQVYDPRRLGNQPWWNGREWTQRSTLNFGLGMPF